MSKKSSELPLLSPDEREACNAIVARNIARVSQRAQALLLIDEGATQAETVNKTGLTIGQVRYAVIRFKKVGLAMFPPDLPDTDSLRPVRLDSEEEPQKIKKKKKGKKGKKKKESVKKSKKKKNGKNSKKDKSSKKKKRPKGKKKK